MFGPKQIEEMIKRALRSYLALLPQPALQSGTCIKIDSEAKVGTTAESPETQETRDQASTSLELLRALFCEHPEFASDQAAKKFIVQVTPKKESLVLGDLVQWAKDMVRDLKARNCILQFAADDSEELMELIEPFAKGGSTVFGKVSYWPLVKQLW